MYWHSSIFLSFVILLEKKLQPLDKVVIKAYSKPNIPSTVSSQLSIKSTSEGHLLIEDFWEKRWGLKAVEDSLCSPRTELMGTVLLPGAGS